MSIKQDRTGTRTSEDLRRRLNVGEIVETGKKVDASAEMVQNLSNQVSNLSNQVTGLHNSVTNTRESYVSTNAQSFTKEQQERARENIGAVGEEVDPTVPSHVKSITTEDISKWNAGTGDIEGILNLICPIGKVEVFFDNEDHSKYLGFTWGRTSIGKVPVGIDTSDSDFNTIGKTGGEKTHTLTINEMPSHKHDISADSFAGDLKIGVTNRASTASDGDIYDFSDFGHDSDSGTGVIYANNTGGNQPHNNLQPYEVMAFWKRIS